MATKTQASSTSFAVHRVERATNPLPTCKTHDAIRALIGGQVESCCDYTGDCITKVHFQPVLAAAHFAFSQHRPLVLSPDMIWVTIVQGFAQHIKNHAEKFRNKFVQQDGKLAITVRRDDFVPGSPENPWATVIEEFSGTIRNHLGATYDHLISNFSTTGPVERTACEVAFLDAFQPYFEYIFSCICGIPEITLEGTTEDWQKLREKVDRLQPYDLDWWLPSLRRMCDQFVRASGGDVDLKHWKDIYKRQTAYGADTVNGWLVQLIPYLKNFNTGNFTIRNPLLEKPQDNLLYTNCLPIGIAQVPFLWQSTAEEVAMEFLGGFVGVTQDTDTLALRPKLGWAVRRTSDYEQSLVRLAKYGSAPALEGPDFDRCFQNLGLNGRCEIGGDLISFYKHCNGVTITGKDDAAFVRFRCLEAAEVIKKLEVEAYPPDRQNSDGEVIEFATGPWLRFGYLADGSFVAIELRYTYEKHSKTTRWKVIRVRAGEERHAVIAWSFSDFLAQAMNQASVSHE